MAKQGRKPGDLPRQKAKQQTKKGFKKTAAQPKGATEKAASRTGGMPPLLAEAARPATQLQALRLQLAGGSHTEEGSPVEDTSRPLRLEEEGGSTSSRMPPPQLMVALATELPATLGQEGTIATPKKRPQPKAKASKIKKPRKVLSVLSSSSEAEQTPDTERTAEVVEEVVAHATHAGELTRTRSGGRKEEDDKWMVRGEFRVADLRQTSRAVAALELPATKEELRHKEILFLQRRWRACCVLRNTIQAMSLEERQAYVERKGITPVGGDLFAKYGPQDYEKRLPLGRIAQKWPGAYAQQEQDWDQRFAQEFRKVFLQVQSGAMAPEVITPYVMDMLKDPPEVVRDLWQLLPTPGYVRRVAKVGTYPENVAEALLGSGGIPPLPKPKKAKVVEPVRRETSEA